MPGRPRQFDRDDVLARAVDLFWQQGYEATSVDDLTAAMGIGRGSLYHEFTDKHTLFIAALDRYRAERRAQLEQILLSEPSAREGVAAVFRRSVSTLWGDPARRGCLLVNSAAELAASDGAVAGRAGEAFDRFADAFRAALESGMRSGELGPDLDADAVAHHLSATLVGLRLLAKFADRAVAEDVVAVALGALDR
jgi:TetR/AcrR family transcriptional regulator, transcriptional repressor for nem operon